MPSKPYDIVLVGGGHSHVEVLRQFGLRPLEGVRLTVVARDIHTPYSGMVPGYLAGHYSHADCHVDLAPLVHRAGARLIHATANKLDTSRQHLECSDGSSFPYDLLSIDIGSLPPVSHIDGAGKYVVPVKPIDKLLARIEDLEKQVKAHDGPFRVMVVGAGAGGVELALALDHRLRGVASGGNGRCDIKVILVDGSPEILPNHVASVRRRMRRALAVRDIEVHAGLRAQRFESGVLHGGDGSRIVFDAAFLVTGAQAAGWLQESGLAVDDGGFVAVDETMRSISHGNIFASGDVAAMKDYALPKAGVYAVRQGPVLAENLRRAAQGLALTSYRPQRHILALISTGDRYAIASRGRLAIAGGWVWHLKDWIDRRWMARYEISS